MSELAMLIFQACWLVSFVPEDFRLIRLEL
jgi:hypothetical protein